MKQVKKQETDNEIKDKSLKWWVNLGHEYAAKLRDKYFPDRTLLTAGERLKIYLSETKANDKPGESDTALNPADIAPLWRDDNGFIAQGIDDDYKTFADTNVNDDDIDDRERRADQLISAFNGTFSKGLNPEEMQNIYDNLSNMVWAFTRGGSKASTIQKNALEYAKSALQKAKL